MNSGVNGGKNNGKNGGWKNEMEMEFDAVSANESFARVAVAAFVSELDPTLEEISDIKTAVSEAVTNAIMAMTGWKAEKYGYAAGLTVMWYILRWRMRGRESGTWRKRWNRFLLRNRN